MPKTNTVVYTNSKHYQDIADAIRSKNGTENTYTPAQMAQAILALEAGEGPIVNNQNKTVTPTEERQYVMADTGYTGLSQVVVEPIDSNFVGSGVSRKTSNDLSAAGATVTVPAGYYSMQTTKSVATGTAGTPIATKSIVSNNSITITPSVTNTTGYITGGTLNGIAVSVTASELVNGTLNIDDDGTYDVTNYASAEVNIDYSSKVISEITISSSGVVSQQLQPDTIYHFTSTALTDLTLTFASVTSTAQYHFDFISPSTAVNLTLPQSVNMPSNFTVEANTRYEIDVINNYGVFAEWVYEVS